MNKSYVFDEEQNLIISIWHGVVTFTEWQAKVNRLVHDPKFSVANKYLVDMRNGSADSSIGEEEIKEIADLIASKSKEKINMKMAIVGTKEFEKSLIFRSLMNPEIAAVIAFSDFNIACKWLEIDAIKTENEIQLLRAASEK